MQLACVAILLFARPASGGICWSSMGRGGRCGEAAGAGVSRATCCARPAAAWSAQDLDPGALFFWRVLGGGVPCTPCTESCSGVSCPSGRRCAVRGGRARCVCAAACARAGPVCGSDARTYRSLCRLRRRACRGRRAALTLAYYGPCQTGSCTRVRCGAGKRCLLDQELRAHCARCGTCASGAGGPVCGADARSYAGACALRRAACVLGRAIPLAYRGPCQANATCATIRCASQQQCVRDSGGAGARCMTCARRCPRPPRRSPLLCASDGRAYASWCHAQREACARRRVVDVLHSGPCRTDNSSLPGDIKVKDISKDKF